MNQLAEQIYSLSHALSFCEHVGNLIRSKYGVELDTRTMILYGIIGFLCIWIYYVSKRRPKRPKHKPISPKQARCYHLGEIYGGDLVLQRLEQINEANVNPEVLANTENLLKALLQEEHLDLVKLQQTVAKLELSGSEDSAVEILKEAAKKARDKNKPHEAYEIEMLLVEMLLYKGDFENALNCECLKDESIKDKRRPLYKAVIHKMLKDIEKAKECWKEFVEVRDPCIDNGAYHQTDFKEFEESVHRLQLAIQEFKRRNPTMN